MTLLMRKRKRIAGAAIDLFPGYIARDLFNRANGAVGTADKGGAWTFTGAMALTLASSHAESNAATGQVAKLGATADGTVGVRIESADWGLIFPGICFRVVDALNYLCVRPISGTTIALLQMIAGVETQLTTGARTFNNSEFTAVKVVFSGNTVNVSTGVPSGADGVYTGTPIAAFTLTGAATQANLPGTICGLRGTEQGATRNGYDDYFVTSP